MKIKILIFSLFIFVTPIFIQANDFTILEIYEQKSKIIIEDYEIIPSKSNVLLLKDNDIISVPLDKKDKFNDYIVIGFQEDGSNFIYKSANQMINDLVTYENKLIDKEDKFREFNSWFELWGFHIAILIVTFTIYFTFSRDSENKTIRTTTIIVFGIYFVVSIFLEFSHKNFMEENDKKIVEYRINKINEYKGEKNER